MAKRLTRDMADNAAKELAKIAFDKKIEAALNRMKEFADKVINKYIPAPILTLAKEYPSFFQNKGNMITVYEENGHSYYRVDLYSNIVNPITRKYIEISCDEYKKAKQLEGRCMELRVKKNKYEKDVSNALMQLKTEKRIKEQFPEALQYLNFTETTALVPQFTKLRAMLK